MYFDKMMRWMLMVTFFCIFNLPSSYQVNTSFNRHVVFQPPQSWIGPRVLYTRTAQLKDESLLMTWEQYMPDPVSFPVYKSTDYGLTWKNLAQVNDQASPTWGLRYQPYFFVLDAPFAEYPAGTVLMSGISFAKGAQGPVNMELYASQDQGITWDFISHIAKGAGPELTDNGSQAIWEPFFLLYEGTLICYFSDQRDPKHAQKLVQVTTTDLKNWTTPVDTVVFDEYRHRPGMATVAKIESSGNYIITFEYCGRQSGGCPVYYAVAKDPLQFQAAPKIALQAKGVGLASSPYVIYYRAPGDSGPGIIIANGNSRAELFINANGGDENSWKLVNSGENAAYSRALRVIRINGQDKLLITSAGRGGNPFKPNNPTNNTVQVGLIEIPHI